MNWATHLLAVVSMTWSPVVASTLAPSCTAGAFQAGGSGSITCHFGTDVNSTKSDFNVAQYATFSFTDTGTTILACNWKEDDLACTPKEGFQFDRTPLVDQLTLSIDNVIDAMAGAYVCSLVGETTGALTAVPCNLTVTEAEPPAATQQPTEYNIELTSTLTNITDTSENPPLIDLSPGQQLSQKSEGSPAVLIVLLVIFILVSLTMAAGCLFLKFKYRLVRRQDNNIISQNNEIDVWDSLVFCKPVAWLAGVYRTVVNRLRGADEESLSSSDDDVVLPLTSYDVERQYHIQPSFDDQTKPQSRNGSTKKSDLDRSPRHSQKTSPGAALSESRPSSKSQGSLTPGHEMELFPLEESTSRTSSQLLPITPNRPKSKSEASLTAEYLPVSVRKGGSRTGSQLLHDTTHTVRDIVDGSTSGTPVKNILSSASGSSSHGGSVSDSEDDADAQDRDSNSISTSSIPPEGCSICEAGSISRPKRLSCGHIFCEQCIQKCLQEEQFCPECKLLLDPEYGNQPSDGTMSMFYSDKQSLPGYQGTGSYIIKYNFPSGIQGDDHPNPGKQYQGLRRSAYLPDNPEGRQVLMLLKTAFDRRLVFTVGHLSSGVVGIIWNNISHKTSMTGGLERNGYPDEYYLDEVQKELAGKSVTEHDLTTQMKSFIHNPRNFIRNTRDDFSGLFKTVHSTQC